MTAGCCGSTTAARCLPTTWCWRSAIRRRQRRPSSRTWRTALDMSAIPGASARSRTRKHRQRAARGQRPHDGRRGAAARRPASARQAHSRAVAPWLAAGTAGLGAIARDQARRCRRARGGARFDAPARAGLSHADARRSTAPAATGAKCWRSRADSCRRNGTRSITRSARGSCATSRSAWDVNRHRVPAGPLTAVRSLARAGVLDVHAGRLEEANAARRRRRSHLAAARRAHARAPGSWIGSSTAPAPSAATERVADPLVQSLLSSGTIRPDALSLGIDIADDGRPISRDGTPVDRLYYLGPWLRARDWEATAVPELREHAAALARSLARRNLVESAQQSC